MVPLLLFGPVIAAGLALLALGIGTCYATIFTQLGDS